MTQLKYKSKNKMRLRMIIRDCSKQLILPEIKTSSRTRAFLTQFMVKTVNLRRMIKIFRIDKLLGCETWPSTTKIVNKLACKHKKRKTHSKKKKLEDTKSRKRGKR